MLQVNPKLTPNMVKMALMYTADPLPGFNMLEQGSGELNIEGAARLAKSIRTDLTSNTAMGSPMLNGPAPNPQTTIGGNTFTWSQGIILKHWYATGTALITTTKLLCDGRRVGRWDHPQRGSSWATAWSWRRRSPGRWRGAGDSFYQRRRGLGDGSIFVAV
jgi:hypothetical protein